MRELQAQITAVRVTHGRYQHFFGYYDKCPWNASGRYLLAHRVAIPTRMLNADDAATLGIVDLGAGFTFRAIGETTAWHWQQGAMLQWWPGDPEYSVIYNVRTDDGFGAVIQDIRSRALRRLPRPVAAVSHDGRTALSINFSRLADERPGYGYVGVPDPWRDVWAPEEDGIYAMDLETGRSELVISLARVRAFQPDGTMRDVKHWFNHLLFSPDDRRFIFLHRWRRPGGESTDAMHAVARHYTRMFTANPDGSGLFCLNDHEMTSHFDWRDPEHVLAFARRRGIGDAFYLFTDRSNEVTIVGARLLAHLGDGHCSYSPDRRWILSDTYPDREQKRLLYVYDPHADRRVDLGTFFSEPSWPIPCRCDLHPRWSREGRHVCFDSSHEGSRQIYLMDVGRLA